MIYLIRRSHTHGSWEVETSPTNSDKNNVVGEYKLQSLSVITRYIRYVRLLHLFGPLDLD